MFAALFVSLLLVITAKLLLKNKGNDDKDDFDYDDY